MFDQYIGRWVTFVLGPITLVISGVIAVKSNQWFGLHLDQSAVAVDLGVVEAGVGIAIYKWLHNRGEFERAEKFIEDLYVNGENAVNDITPKDTNGK